MTPEQTQILNLATSLGITSESEAMDIILAVQTANTPSVTAIDNTQYSLATLGERCAELLGSESAGLQARRIFSDALQGAIEARVPGYSELIVAQQALASGKLTFSGDDRQAVIDALGASWPDEIRITVKSLGRRVISPAEQAGLAPITAEQITDALIARDDADIRDATRNWWTARYAVVEDGLHNGTITTQQQVIDAIGGA